MDTLVPYTTLFRSHRIEDGDLDSGASNDPADKGDGGDAEDDRHKYCADLVDQPLDRRLRPLGAFDETDDPREGRFGPDCGGLDEHEAIAIDGAAGQLVPDVLRDGHALDRKSTRLNSSH